MDSAWIAVIVLLWVFMLVLSFFLIGALRQIAVLQLRLGNDPGALITRGGLDRGTLAPSITALDIGSHEWVSLESLARQARALIFLSPTCSACRHLIPHINEVAKTRRGEFDFVVICRGDEGSCLAMGQMEGLDVRMLVDLDGTVETAFDIQMTPFTYVLDYRGRVLVRGVTNDWRHLESLLDQEGTVESADDGEDHVVIPVKQAVASGGEDALRKTDSKGGKS